jgi:hypothetical protein
MSAAAERAFLPQVRATMWMQLGSWEELEVAVVLKMTF